MMLRYTIKKIAPRRDSAHARAHRHNREVKIRKTSETAHKQKNAPRRRESAIYTILHRPRNQTNAPRRRPAHARADRQNREVKLTKMSAHADAKRAFRRCPNVRIGTRMNNEGGVQGHQPPETGGGLRRGCVPPKILHHAGAAATFPPKPRAAQGRQRWLL